MVDLQSLAAGDLQFVRVEAQLSRDRGVDVGHVAAVFDGDGKVASQSDLLICVRGDRRTGPRLKWKVRPPTAASEFAFADADNDGHGEIVYTGTDGFVHCVGSRR